MTIFFLIALMYAVYWELNSCFKNESIQDIILVISNWLSKNNMVEYAAHGLFAI